MLIANLAEMLDDRGDWKALDTAGIRGLVHAATMAGRLAAAETAVQLGYAIEPDRGPSGKLDHWRIADTSHVYVAADDLDQAVEDLTVEWSADRRQRWVLDVDEPPSTSGSAARASPAGLRAHSDSPGCVPNARPFRP